jgi:hypothetical protein
LSESGAAAIICQSIRWEFDSSQFDEETTMPQRRHVSWIAHPDSFVGEPHLRRELIPGACPPSGFCFDAGPRCRRNRAEVVS